MAVHPSINWFVTVVIRSIIVKRKLKPDIRDVTKKNPFCINVFEEHSPQLGNIIYIFGNIITRLIDEHSEDDFEFLKLHNIENTVGMFGYFTSDFKHTVLIFIYRRKNALQQGVHNAISYHGNIERISFRF